jgi:pullulanase/glycogen debranching enzyme
VITLCRGTYAGLGSSWAIDYFRDLGITAVELLPVHQFVDDKILADRGLHNYWGYNSIGYFAPDSRYSSSGVTGGQVQVGNFPVLWAEWNGKYRDSVRSYWKGDEGQVGEIAYRLTGSPDLYQWNGKRPQASINFVTAHPQSRRSKWPVLPGADTCAPFRD